MFAKMLSILLVVLLLTSTAFAYEELQTGSKGDAVVKLQKALIDLGYLNGKADGDYGKMTAAAVSSFQKDHDLPETGIADDATQSAIFAAAPDAAYFSSSDDQMIYDVLVYFSDSIGDASYQEVKVRLDNLGIKYKTTISADELATFTFDCGEGDIYICCYPLTLDDWAFGNPVFEKLAVIEYHRGDKWINVGDSLHTKRIEYGTGDRNRDPVNQNVGSLDELLAYYDEEIGGNLSQNKQRTSGLTVTIPQTSLLDGLDVPTGDD